jgi:PAS domain-containing protein
MSEAYEVAVSILRKWKVPRKARFTLEQARNIARAHMPDETTQVIDNVAAEIVRIDGLEQGPFNWCERCMSYHHESAPHTDRAADITRLIQTVVIGPAICLKCRRAYPGNGKCPHCAPQPSDFATLLNTALDASFACGEHNAIHQEEYAELSQELQGAKDAVLAQHRELLEALRDMVFEQNRGTFITYADRLFEAARLAIAQAEGRS